MPTFDFVLITLHVHLKQFPFVLRSLFSSIKKCHKINNFWTYFWFDFSVLKLKIKNKIFRCNRLNFFLQQVNAGRSHLSTYLLNAGSKFGNNNKKKIARVFIFTTAARVDVTFLEKSNQYQYLVSHCVKFHETVLMVNYSQFSIALNHIREIRISPSKS